MEQNNTSGLAAGEVKSATCAADRWRAILAEQRESGLGMAEFCRQRSIRPTTFYSWRQKLEGPGRRTSTSPLRSEHSGSKTVESIRRASVAVRSSPFVSVKLAAGKAACSGRALEVCLRGGRRLRVRGPFDRALLVELIGVLEGLA